MPFPETEIMTIKRLEVALRKMDLKLLKDGAYKLHEKYHSGYKFEYLDLLKDILSQTSNNTSIPEDIRDILCYFVGCAFCGVWEVIRYKREKVDPK